MIVCWPITTAVKHVVRHHVVPPIRRILAARPPVKTVTKWACVVVATGGAVGGGALYGPGLFAPPPAAIATVPAFTGSPGGLLFPAPGSGGFEFAPPNFPSNSVTPEFLILPPDMMPNEVLVAGSLTTVLTPPVPSILETPVFAPAAFTPIGDTSTPQPVPEPSSLLLLATGMAALVFLRKRFR